MKSYTTWIADDGKEFDTREECEAYERRYSNYEAILQNEANIEFYGNGNRITEIKFDENCNFINRSDLMIVKNYNAIKALCAVAERVGFCDIPQKTGVFFYDPHAPISGYCWVRIEPAVLENILAVPSTTIKAMLN